MRRMLVMILILTAWMQPSPASAEIVCQPGTPEPATSAAMSAADVPFPEAGGTVHIFAAASLADAFTTIEGQIEEAHPNVDITIETAGSNALVTQLEEGAQADILATADWTTMQRAQDGGLLASEPSTFAHNTLVIVTPEDNPANVTTLDDLIQGDLEVAIAAPDVPAGGYTRDAICAYADNGVNTDVIDMFQGNVVSEEPDVRHVLSRVQLGEVDAGIVYASDATASQLAGTPLQVIPFPDALQPEIAYPIAPVASDNVELSNAVIAYIQGPEGQAVLQSFGFS